MASVDCATRLGISGAATHGKAGNCFLITRTGIGLASIQAPAVSTTSVRRSLDWLPRADEVWIDPKTGRPTRRFYQLMREICERRLGGVAGKTVPEVVTDVVSAQQDVTATISFATQVSQYAESIAATANTTAQVTLDNGLSGASSIPPAEERGPAWVDSSE